MITLKDKVEHCLNKYTDSRNSDTKLINCVYVEFYNSFLFKTRVTEGEWVDKEKEVYAVTLLNMYELPNPSHIIRWRQKLNEQGKYLPTDESVIVIRKKQEKMWREEMSPSNPDRG